MSRSKSSKYWLKNHFRDPYIIKRNIINVRSRAWFKLQEIDKLFNIFYSGINVIDLGSSPGGWSQYAQKKVGKNGIILSCDLIPMKNLNGVTFICGDIFSDIVLKKINSFSKKHIWSVIMSDISPNISGYSLIDDSKMLSIGEKILDFSKKFLCSTGFLIIKFFQGKNIKIFLKKIFNIFLQVKIYKPNSSRASSREVFIIAHKHKL